MPHRGFIGIGTNLGDRAANYREAITRIAGLPESRVIRQSSAYETEPVGDVLMLKWPFLNGVVEADTELTPEELMKRLDIEEGAERIRNLLYAMTLEVQMLARSCGKSDVHHLEPEDMAALSLEASAVTGLPLAGTRKVFGR